MAIFQMLTNDILVDIVSKANQRVIYIAPGIWLNVAKALSKYQRQNEAAALEIILDPNPQVCRLGYGELEAIKHLDAEDIYLRKCPGIRVGLLIVDKEAWFFTPTPQLVEEELTSMSNFSPNAVAISLDEANQLLGAIAPKLVVEELLGKDNKLSVIGVPTPEIAHQTFEPKDLHELEADLEKCPPQQFDLARQVNVYSSYIQFVELNLEGTHLTRHTVSIPQELLNLASSQKDKDRLKASYQIIKPGSKLSGKEMHEKVKAVRDKYLKSIGNNYGRVILKQHKDAFTKDLIKLQNELNSYKGKVQTNLDKEIKECTKSLKGILGPAIQKNPPDELKYGINTAKPDKATVDKYLDKKLETIIPGAEDFVNDMVIRCQFKDVTYEMLHEDSFIDGLHKAFPYAGWPQIPINEYKAAPVKQ